VAAERIAAAIPADVHRLMATLWAAGHAAYVVGGSLRDVLLGRPAADWDLATDALPDVTLALFPGAVYENRFGTVGVRLGGAVYEITTFRREHQYADFRRPQRVEFGATIEEDLARRDFTVNAMAWGAPAPERAAGRPQEPLAGPTRGRPARGEPPSGDAALPPAPHPASPRPTLVDPFDGIGDCQRRRLRAVGDPLERFDEDALRIVRAARLAAVLEFTIDPPTLAAMAARADRVRFLSGERIAAELERLLAAPRPSLGLRILADTGVLAQIAPELAAQRGVPQNKIPGDDLWDHTLRTVDAVPPDRPLVRLAALVHDIGKPATLADGRFLGHERVGAEMAAAFLRRLRYPSDVVRRVRALVAEHMWQYDRGWSDAAVRRFLRRVGPDLVEDLFLLREADNLGSGRPAEDGGLADLRRRVAEQLAARVALDRSDLAINGDDLIRELGLSPGPAVGRILSALLERVLVEPELNERDRLLTIARQLGRQLAAGQESEAS
jgi:tRNA nucleotidyltransferase (CCA-adding enzyme)